MTKNILFGILLIIFIIPFSASFAESSSVLVKSHEVNYTIENGSVESITLDPDFLELIINMQTNDDGTLEINIPRSLLDAKFESEDDIFFVLVNSFETNYVEISSNSDSRVLVIPFFGGDSVIEIIGTHALNPLSENSEKKIPDWVRNNAGWWADGKIEDSDFVSGIQFLISKGIMTIPPTQSDEPSNQEIPDWVRNNAGWWADGKIEDSDFVSGIQFLISKGIMII